MTSLIEASLIKVGRETPNPSLEPTRYGSQRKPGTRHTVHHRVPGLRCLPTRAAQLERYVYL